LWCGFGAYGSRRSNNAFFTPYRVTRFLMAIRTRPTSWNETDRLAALARYAILDTPPEPEYDDIARLVARTLKVPIAVINLVAEGRQWFKAEVGLGVRETPLDTSFCAHAIRQPGGMVVPDTRDDPRFDCNPLVTGEPGLRFYAGELLESSEGLPIGTLCVLDTEPRSEGLTDDQRFFLKTLARQVMTQLELRHAVVQRDKALAQQYRLEVFHRQILDSASDHAIIGINLEGRIVSWNAGAANVLGWSKEEALGNEDVMFFTREDAAAGVPKEERRCALDTGRSAGERWHVRKDGSLFWASGEMTPLREESGNIYGLVKVLHDRTRQHVAESALKHSEAAARAMADRYALVLTAGAILGTWIMDLRTRIITGDAAMAATLDIDPEAFRAGVPVDRILAAIHPDDAGRPGIFDDAALARAGSYRSEYRLRHAGHGSRWVETNGNVEHDGAGRPLRAFGVVIDVHGRKINELRQAALIALSDRFQHGNDVTSISLAAAELVGNLLAVDRTGYAQIQSARQQIVMERDWTSGRVASLAGKTSIAIFPNILARLAKGAPVVIHDREMEPSHQCDIEGMRIAEVRGFIGVPLLNQGRLAGFAFAHTREPRTWQDGDVAFLRDVAGRTWAAIRRVEAEEALKQAANDLEAQVAERTRERDLLWRTSEDLFVVCDFDGSCRSVNPAWSEALGYTSEELGGMRFDALVHADDFSTIEAAYKRVMYGVPTRLADLRMRHKNGEYRWYSWHAVSDRNALYGAGRDVTERRWLEEQLRQSQKMEAVGQLTGGIAHDFNNLLHGMLGNLEIMQFRLGHDPGADVSHHIRAAIEAANRSAALTHRLLAFSRQQTLDPKPTDVNMLVASMEELIHGTTGPAITVRTILSPSLWPTLCDSHQLENALLNLVINARDAMPGGGRITISTANVVLDEARTLAHSHGSPSEFVKLSVTDNGVGMAPEILSRAMDPFFTTKPMGRGTGLGLSMIYGFVGQSHGHLRLDSEPGQGTTVQIYLPRHARQDAADPVKELSPLLRSAKTGATILLVDDEQVVRTLLTEVVEVLGYDVIAAADGTAAWEVLKSTQKIDLLLTDIGLPGGMNGRELADAARDIQPNLKVLFITGFAEQAVLSDGSLQDGMEVMTKPFSMNSLAEKIGAMLEKV
jgi:PAS domain S-box-containing protein